ncbi:MAG: neutral zinc metallopeptidase [Actinomycetota bacterium]|nr:neutral zinc metallopeptidase [Actinomycetota bacterium]
MRRVLLLLVITALAACASSDGGREDRAGERRESDTTDESPPGTFGRATDTTFVDEEQEVDPETEARIQELIDDTEAAVEVVDGYWQTHWSDFFTGTYTSPTVHGGYVGDENPPCGGVHEDGTGNAYYCPPDDYLAWDWELMAGGYSDENIGDSFVYMVIAHEWAHAIQARLQEEIVSAGAELQADCLAAATLTGAANDGTLTFEPGDRGEIFTALVAVADEVEWGDPADHGAADQRVEAYQTGEEGGVEACLPEQTAG